MLVLIDIISICTYTYTYTDTLTMKYRVSVAEILHMDLELKIRVCVLRWLALVSDCSAARVHNDTQRVIYKHYTHGFHISPQIPRYRPPL